MKVSASIALLCYFFSKNKSDSVKTNPFLYLKRSVFLATKSKFDIAIAAKKALSKYLDEITKGYPKNEIGFYTVINNINNKESSLMATIQESINELKSDIRGHEPKELTEHQEQYIYLIWGSYNAFSILSRLSRLHSGGLDSTEFLRKLYSYLLLTETLVENKNQKNTEVFHKTIALMKKDRVTKELSFRRKKVEEMVHFYLSLERLITRAPQQIYDAIGVLKASFKSPIFDYLATFETFSNQSILLLQPLLLEDLKAYPTAQKLQKALEYIEVADRESALTVLTDLVTENKLEQAPHFLQKITCTLYVGLLLSKKYSIGTRFSYRYVLTYLQTSFPGFQHISENANEHDVELFKQLQYHQDSEKPVKGENDGYDIQFGYINLIGEYNQFIIRNDLSYELLVNPLEQINLFLNDFFENLDNKTSLDEDYPSRCAKALKGLITKLRNANIPSVDFSILDLRTSYILKLLSLYDISFEKNYEGTQAIRRFLSLLTPEQKVILEACRSVLEH